MEDFSHVDDKGRARMVDVGAKPQQRRRAIARGQICLSAPTVELIRQNQVKRAMC